MNFKHSLNYDFVLYSGDKTNIYLVSSAFTSVPTSLLAFNRALEWVPGTLSLRVKQPGCEVDHSPTFSAKVKG
jgi:hypothetical protein